MVPSRAQITDVLINAIDSEEPPKDLEEQRTLQEVAVANYLADEDVSEENSLKIFSDLKSYPEYLNEL